jgi:hypothetical protein
LYWESGQEETTIPTEPTDAVDPYSALTTDIE